MAITPAAAAELGAFGAFFAVSTHDAAPGEPWRPLGDLVEDVAVLNRRVDAVRHALARGAGRRVEDVQQRVAASTTHLGLVARLLAPAVATAALGSHHLDLALDGLWWQDRLGAPFPLSVPTGPPAVSDRPSGVDGTAVEAITDAIGRGYSVSARVLWGNVGSAVNTAARLVSGARPDLTRHAYAMADVLLADPRIDVGALRAGPDFRRRSCCLIYRVGGASAQCEDCILTGRP